MLKHAAIFFDADALIAGAASRSGASFVLLQLCELGLLQGLTCTQVISECRKNLQLKLPQAVPVFETLVERTLTVHRNPTGKELEDYPNMADPKDLPILVAAILQNADYLVTFNTRHFFPDPATGLTVCKPGELLQTIRQMLNRLTDE